MPSRPGACIQSTRAMEIDVYMANSCLVQHLSGDTGLLKSLPDGLL